MLPLVSFGAFCGLIAAHSRILRLWFLTIGLFAGIFVWNAIPHPREGGDIRLYSKNLHYDNEMMDEIAADIIAADVDLVMLQEVTIKSDKILDALKTEFPYQHLCQTSSYINVALLSRHGFTTPPRCSERRAIVLASIGLNQEQVWVGSVHVPWPWPATKGVAERQMIEMLAEIQGPVILAGDFNTFPWSARMQAVRDATGSETAGPLRLTLEHPKIPIPLPLDYALGPHGGTLSLRPLLGADHRGIVASLPLLPQQ